MNFQLLIDALTQIITDIVTFIPRFINGLVIMLVGVLIAWLVRWVLRTVLVRLRFDALVERTGVTGALRELGVKTALSQIIAQALFVLLLLSFLISSTRLMGLEPVAQLLTQLLQFLPNIIAALIIFLLGGIAAQFVGNLVAAAGAASGLRDAARVGRLVRYLISMFVVILALGQLGVDTSILVTTLTIVIAAFGLALALALGLGARVVVHHILCGYYLRQRFPVGQRIVLGEVQGAVSTIGGVNTVLTAADGQVVIPNSVLLESIVRAPPPPPLGNVPVPGEPS